MSVEMSWGTENEIRFINGLGGFSETRASREELLEKYIESIGLRRNFCDINRDVVTRVAKDALNRDSDKK